MPPEPWLDRLGEEAGKLWEELRAVRHPSVAGTGPDEGTLQQLLKADAPPWKEVSAEERASFAEGHGGQRLDEIMRVALDPMSTLVAENDRQNALVQLIAWDHRYLYFPTVRTLLRIAQTANDQPFLRSLGEAVARNERYAGRGMRGQRLLSRLLEAFAFSDKTAYAEQSYRDLVRERLRTLFAEVGVPADEPAWNVLNDRNYFNKHLVRLGFRS